MKYTFVPVGFCPVGFILRFIWNISTMLNSQPTESSVILQCMYNIYINVRAFNDIYLYEAKILPIFTKKMLFSLFKV